MTDGCNINLLDEAIFSGRMAEGDVLTTYTLPGILAAYSRSETLTLTALRPHQRHAWHTFAVQLGALVMHAAGGSECFDNEAEWKRRLLQLTGGDVTPWCLAVDDWTKPAFMQPGTPAGSKGDYKSQLETPDDLDVLVLAKGHDVKPARLPANRPEHWGFALVTAQALEGYGGVGNYGAARMNGGYGSRSEISLTVSPLTGTRFCHEVRLWLDQRDQIVDAIGYTADGGLALLWTQRWDGSKEPVKIEDCDPIFIDLSRRLRVSSVGTSFIAHFATSKGAFLAQDLHGNSGEIWVPIKKAEGKGLSISEAGASYAKIHEWVFSGDWESSATLRKAARGADLLVVRGLARGQGKTDGWHERVLPLPAGIRASWGEPSFQQRLGELSKQRVEVASNLRSKALRPAIAAFLDGRTDAKPDDRANSWLRDFEMVVDQGFFEHLFRDVELEAEASREGEIEWERLLEDGARKVLEQVYESAPTAGARRYRAIAAADTRFRRGAKKALPLLTDFRSAERAAKEVPNAKA